jgi:DNA-binding NarL/FixJ family response regulator
MRGLKIILVDDNELFRKALKTILIREFNAEIIGEASSAREFESLPNYAYADIILMDIMMPETDGITLSKKIFWTYPHLKIIGITMHTDQVYLISLIETGFKGCLFKNSLFENLSLAINTVLSGQLFFPENILLSKNGYKSI